MTHALGINPGGEALTLALDKERDPLPPPEMREKLLSKADMESWTPLLRLDSNLREVQECPNCANPRHDGPCKRTQKGL